MTDQSENYVGQLQEICVRRHYQHPRYSYEFTENNDNRNWIATVIVGRWRKSNAAATKKLAKRKAAQHLVRLMKIFGSDFECDY